LGGFSAHLVTWTEINNIPTVCYVSVVDYYDICLDSVKVLYGTAATYASMREKLDDSYLTTNNVNLKTSVFHEFQAVKEMLYV